MATFIEVLANGDLVMVNIDKVTKITPAGDRFPNKCSLHFSGDRLGDEYMVVDMSYADFCMRMRRA